MLDSVHVYTIGRPSFWVDHLRTALVNAPSALNSGNLADLTGALPLLSPPVPALHFEWIRNFLTSVDLTELGCRRTGRIDQVACRAGFLQCFDFLDASHTLSQSIEGEGESLRGDYWHAIMHRREPDYGNAKYWFRRIGRQPVFHDLPKYAEAALSEPGSPDFEKWKSRLCSGSKWDPLAFVDLCETAAGDEDSELGLAARKIQYAEMSLLLAESLGPTR